MIVFKCNIGSKCMFRCEKCGKMVDTREGGYQKPKGWSVEMFCHNCGESLKLEEVPSESGFEKLEVKR